MIKKKLYISDEIIILHFVACYILSLCCVNILFDIWLVWLFILVLNIFE
jgi:hypothetical protein